MKLIDTHIHLNFPQFHGDLEQVIERMKQASVTGAINIGVDAKSSQESVKLAERLDWLFASVGVHPHSADEINQQIEIIEELASHPKVVAIGEIGLDYYRNLVSAGEQVEAFKQQLQIALKHQKPVILHCRDSYAQVISVLEDFYLPHLNGRHPGVVHSFTGTPSYAQKFLKLGFNLGINNIVTYPSSKTLQEAVKIIPLDRILLETDSPYLPPQHLRGERCEPSYVVEAARKVAELKGVSVKEVVDATTRNANTLFGLNHD